MQGVRDWLTGQREYLSSKGVEWWAGLATVIWVEIIVLLVGVRYEEFLQLKLNELGDFFAGAFGPVAFAWLVIGYLQQGKELKISSAALGLQANELKELVRGQGQLVEASEIPFEPSFSLTFITFAETIGGPKAFYKLENSAARALEVIVYFILDDVRGMGISFGEIAGGTSREVSFDDPRASTLGGFVQVVYRRALNRPGFPRHSPSSGNSAFQTPLAIAA
ncbi:hypothetical protein [Pseudomonas sp. BN411]|uniref:hypothetical protein n=1 Tax=Pseudomonas sp. BN411 TaxID=2567887 RepID=UPI0024571A80|nr:hypothetical protein [Pseudomonas sp. BN411]MDH4562289.1 hypothetical protein [Pseudomonas sp. BN411]